MMRRRATRTYHQGQRMHPFRLQQAVDMSARLATGHRPDTTGICAKATSRIDVNRLSRIAAVDAAAGGKRSFAGRLKRRKAPRLAVFSTVKLLGQPQQTPAFSEPIRDGLRHAHFEDQPEPKSRF
jgi:hypothetical protein